ncbi:hypothetical protein IQ07DRAFT_588489 [Pyrenochaeta sp. DS3sAY3a]|nr:hypothetical protein IQ07DRAFT_588489 [Pyrenochaeta sp. DS3sAY3a]
MPNQERPPDPPGGAELPEELLTQSAQLRMNDAEDVDQRSNALSASHQEGKAKLEKALARIAELEKALDVAKIANLEKALATSKLETALAKFELEKALAEYELQKALAHKVTEHEKALDQIASLEKALAQRATEREKLLTENKGMKAEHEQIVKELQDEACKFKTACPEGSIQRDRIRKDITEEIFDGLPEILHKAKNAEDSAEGLEITRGNPDAREDLLDFNHALAPAELDEAVAKAYKEGDLRGYHRYAMDMDIALADRGSFTGVTIEKSRSAYLLDKDHPRCPMNIGYANGYSMTGAWGASVFNVEEFDLRSYKAPSVTKEMLEHLDPDQESRYWQGFSRGKAARIKEMELVLQDLKKKKSGNA